MKRMIVFGLLLTLMVGCARHVEPLQPFVIKVFTNETCSYCESLKTELIPQIKATYGDLATIEYYSMDKKEHLALYDDYVGLYNPDTKQWDLEGRLKNVDKDSASYQRYVPLVIVDEYYGYIGYTKGMTDAYLEDMKRAFAHQKLTNGKLRDGRFELK